MKSRTQFPYSLFKLSFAEAILHARSLHFINCWNKKTRNANFLRHALCDVLFTKICVLIVLINFELTILRSTPHLHWTQCNIFKKQMGAADKIKRRFNKLVVHEKVHASWEGSEIINCFFLFLIKGNLPRNFLVSERLHNSGK